MSDCTHGVEGYCSACEQRRRIDRLRAENDMLKKALRMFLHLQYPTWPGTPGSGGRVDASAAVAAAKIALGE